MAFGGGSNGGVADNGAKVWLADPGTDTYRFKAYWGAVPTDFDGKAEVHVDVLCSVNAGS